MFRGFMFATGIENSNPTIQNGKFRVDELEKCGHYTFWKKDFELTQQLGIRFLRYGPPIHRTYLGKNKFDWSFADETFGELKRMNMIPITDLCHFGVPDWIGNFQNPEFPELFAEYCWRICPTLSLGAAIHAHQRNVYLRTVLCLLWLVE